MISMYITFFKWPALLPLTVANYGTGKQGTIPLPGTNIRQHSISYHIVGNTLIIDIRMNNGGCCCACSQLR